MKYLLLGAAFFGVIGFAWFGRGEANVYAMAPTEVYAKLRAAPIQADGKSAFGRLDYAISGNGTSKIFWNGSGGTFASSGCEAEITPEGTDKSRIMAFCNGGSMSDGAAAGMVSGMQRKALIEHIDATLTGRPFDVKLAAGSTASGWPSDARQPDGSYGTAVVGALKMEQEIKQMERDMKKDAEQRKTDAAYKRAHAGVQFQAGKPMVDLSPNRR
ncbi:MAG TPA: hypothetical protein VGR05_02070 [Sphingomicrobium sp.]|nr:hypothetical protein [Sphingomicrobium sp.]